MSNQIRLIYQVKILKNLTNEEIASVLEVLCLSLKYSAYEKECLREGAKRLLLMDDK